MSAATLTLGILQADSVLEPYLERHGDYPQMFRDLLNEAAANGGFGRELRFRDYDVRIGERPEPLDACDAYLITGSKLSVYDPEPWIEELEVLVRALHAARIPLVGVCFGHQLIARALGGETREASAGWAVGVHTSRMIAHPSWATPQLEHFSLLSSHKDQVVRLPAEARLMATNDFCPNAAYTVGDHIFCVQSHPEFLPDYARDLMNHRREVLGPGVHDRGIDSLGEPIDRTTFGRWILAFAGRDAA